LPNSWIAATPDGIESWCQPAVFENTRTLNCAARAQKQAKTRKAVINTFTHILL